MTPNERAEIAEISRSLAALRSEVLGLRLHLALKRVWAALLKANFDPNQPRVPRGHPHGGCWTRVGGPGLPVLPASGDEPFQEPYPNPRTWSERYANSRALARWLRKRGVPAHLGRRHIDAIDTAGTLYEFYAFIIAALDEPKTLEELRQAAATHRPDYHVHHIVEQTPAKKEGWPRSMIDAPENKVSIPHYKHEQITAWYGRINPDFGNMKPRDYLRDKSWEEKMRVGLQALIKHGVLKP